MGGHTTTVVAIAAVVAVGCGGADEAIPGDHDARAIDAAVPDGAWDCGVPTCTGACRDWQRIERAADTIVAIDPAGANPERTVRVAMTAEIGSCEELAMMFPRIEEASREVFLPIALLAGEPPCDGAARIVTRPVALRLPATGTWTVYGGPDTTAPSVTIEVGAAPARACGVAAGVPCAMDCDCDEAAGERCLGGEGIGGAFTACARPCELDRDCGGDGRCVSVDDGLDWTCDGQAECDAGHPCPSGFTCAAGTCAPAFTLGGAARVACTCDDDCAGPLRCLGGRCEMACPTGGPWCAGPGAHVCGRAADDLAGLAAVDGVCGWLGE